MKFALPDKQAVLTGLLRHSLPFTYWYSFQVILAILLSWLFCAILTASGALDEDSGARTDTKTDVLNSAAWFRFPYPCQILKYWVIKQWQLALNVFIDPHQLLIIFRRPPFLFCFVMMLFHQFYFHTTPTECAIFFVDPNLHYFILMY